MRMERKLEMKSSNFTNLLRLYENVYQLEEKWYNMKGTEETYFS